MPLLAERQAAAARKEGLPMLAQDLHRTVGPALALGAIGGDAVGQDALAIAAIRVVRHAAVPEDPEAEFGILDDRIRRPAADVQHGLLADEQHRAMRDRSEEHT